MRCSESGSSGLGSLGSAAATWSLRGEGSGIRGLILKGSSGESSIGLPCYRCSKLYYHY
jgi:hypothetical protein